MSQKQKSNLSAIDCIDDCDDDNKNHDDDDDGGDGDGDK